MHQREEVKLTREVGAIQIPDGTPIVLTEGTPVLITQQLGGSFTKKISGPRLQRVFAAGMVVVAIWILANPLN